MTANRALWHSVCALAHPVNISAVIVLLINDHVLRVMWPSWWTGKIGDFAWLAFFPAVLALPLALIVPARVGRREAVVAGLAFGITGVMFAAMKTIPEVMDAGLWLLRLITGGPFVLRVDPTDLLALSGMGIGWWVWRRPVKPMPGSRGWAILAIGALATIATSPPPIMGIFSLSQADDGTIYALDRSDMQYLSKDGGLSWQVDPDHVRDTNESHWGDFTHEGGWFVSDPDNPGTAYRFGYGNSIERTGDGGVTWTVEINLTMTEAQQTYRFQTQDRTNPGPLDAVFNQAHGTVVVAMGDEGILTRSQDGEWHWVSITDEDGYPEYSRHADLTRFSDIAHLLEVQLWLAADLMLLTIGLLGYFGGLGMPSFWRILNGVIACGLWVAVLVVSPAGFGLMRLVFYFYILIFFALSGVFFGVFGIQALDRTTPLRSGLIWQPTLAAPIFFLLPYLMWSQGIAFTLNTAMIVSAALTVGVVTWGCWRLGKARLARIRARR